MIKNFYFLLLTVFTIVGCNKTSFERIYLDQTLCLEPWHVEGASNQEYILNAEFYIANLGVETNIGTSNLELGGPEAAENCGSSCECTTGLKFVIEVNKDDVETLLNISDDEAKFYQE